MLSQALTLALLREALTGDKASLDAPSDKTLAEVFLLSKNHDLSHITGDVLEAHGTPLPPKVKAAFDAERVKAVYRYTRLWSVFGKIEALFEQRGIDYLPLKGAYIRHAYPKPEMRTSCDVDILVKEEDLPCAVALLSDALGFKADGKTYHDVSLTLGEGMHVELHYNITENDGRIDPLLSSVWENAVRIENTHRFKMSPAFFAFHTLAHMYSHFTRGGCGIRTLMDLWVLRHRTDFDEDGTRALCEGCGLLSFYLAAVKLSEVWFSGEAHTPTTALMQDFILRGGIYGTRDNRVAAGAGQKQGRFRYALSRIFPPRKYLSLSYPVLNQHPILMPVCYVRRWLRILFRGKAARALGELSYTASLPKETKEATEALFTALGI